jgi:hypothetical protein
VKPIRPGNHTPHPVGQYSRRLKDRPLWVGFSAVSHMASLVSPSLLAVSTILLACIPRPSAGLPSSAAMPDAGATAPQRYHRLSHRPGPVTAVGAEGSEPGSPRRPWSAPLPCIASEPAAPYLRRCINGLLQHHRRDRVRLVWVSRQEHEEGHYPSGAFQPGCQANTKTDSELCLLDQLAAPLARVALQWRGHGWPGWLEISALSASHSEVCLTAVTTHSQSRKSQIMHDLHRVSA